MPRWGHDSYTADGGRSLVIAVPQCVYSIARMAVYWCAVFQVCINGPSIFRGGGNSRLRSGHLGRKLYTASRCPSGKYRVKRGDFCSQIISKYCGGSVATFQRLNSGFVCTNDKLYVGQILCTLIYGWGNVGWTDVNSELYTDLQVSEGK